MEWTREQEIVALYLYCLIPFNRVTNSNPQIKAMSELIGRPNSNSLKTKIANFGHFDTHLVASGLNHTSRLDEEIWNEYCGRWQELEIDALEILEQFQNQSPSVIYEIPTIPQGQERETIVRQRANQYLFRNMVLSAYNNTCCITGLARQELLDACHIVDWATNEANRLNPCNGLAMNVLFHRAYDDYFLGITPDLEVVVSDRLYDGLRGVAKKNAYDIFSKYAGSTIATPKKFKPELELVEKKYQTFLKAN